MTEKEKAKAYDEAIEKGKQILNTPYTAHWDIMKEVVEHLLPALKESDDEKIRKELIDYFKENNAALAFRDISNECVIAWLEKQGAKVSAIEGFESEFERQVSCLIASAINKEHEYNQGYVKWTANALLNYAKHEIEKQGEKKSDDKVESRFKVGDWVVYDHRAYQVVELPKEGYINLGLRRNEKIEFAPSTYCRLWTIQDAKDGDALTCYSDIKGQPIEQTGIIKQYVGRHGGCSNSFKAHFGVDWDNNVVIEGYMGSSNIYPATKEQRGLLFQKMNEAGYEWDSEKKELKKIEQKSTAWSEEDEKQARQIKRIVRDDGCTQKLQKQIADWLKSIKDRVQPQSQKEWSEEDKNVLDDIKVAVTSYWDADTENIILNWLKSLRPKSQWKPSEEQMDALLVKIPIEDSCNKVDNILKSLYSDLKKLK